MTVELLFRASCLVLAALIAIRTYFMWRRGEHLRRELDETRRCVKHLSKLTGRNENE